MSITRRRRSAAPDGDTSRSPRVGRVRGGRRFARGALVVAAGTAALSLAGPLALRPFADAAHAAGSAGEVSVAFVLDFGGSSGDQVVGCVTVPSSDTRYDALAAFVQEKGLTQPGYAPSGLLCSINGVPSSGCGQVIDGGYIYWAYFTGGAHGWVYSSTGAFGTVGTDDVEGWRFENPGSGNPGDPGPRTAPRYNAICGSTTPTTLPTGGSGGGGGGHGGGGGGGAGQGRAHTATHSRTPGGAAAASGGPSTTSSSPTPSSTAPSTTTSTVCPNPTTSSTTTSSTTSTPPTSSAAASSTTTSTTSTTPCPDTATSSPDTSVTTDPTVGLANTRHASSGGSGPGPDPMIVGGLLIAALAIAGYTRWRKRPRTP